MFAISGAPAAAPPSSLTLLSSLRGDLWDPPMPSRKPQILPPPLLAPQWCTGEENKDSDGWIDTDIDGSEVGMSSDVALYDST